MKIADLPKIDYILISHDHYDHLDLPTIKELVGLFHPRILAGLGVKKLLADKNIGDVVELDWWQTYQENVKGIEFTFVPALHNSGRSLWGDNRTLWGGFVMESPAGRVYFAGDTGYGGFIDSIKARYNGFRLTVLPVGNYEKRWFMKGQHLNPEDAVLIQRLLSSRMSIGIHCATFAEHPEQAIDAHEVDLQAALTKYAMDDSAFRNLKFGEGLMLY